MSTATRAIGSVSLAVCSRLGLLGTLCVYQMLLHGSCRSEARGDAQGLGAIGALPGEVRLGPAEVAVRGGLGINRAQQVELVNEGPGTQVEDLADGVLDPLDRHLL